MFVYVIVNNESLKIYIGQHKGDNLRKYLQDKFAHAKHYPKLRSHLFAAMRAYPRDGWSIHPLISDLQTREECDHWERVLIKALNSQHPDVGYNICRGGEGFTGPQSESAKAKITAALIGRPVSAETRAKIGASQPRSPKQLAAIDQTGRHHSTETKERIRQHNATGACGMLGRKHSPETLAKMSASAKRRGISPETQCKMIAASIATRRLRLSIPLVRV